MDRRYYDGDARLRLECLRAAIELRSPGTTIDTLLKSAALFHDYVSGGRDRDCAGTLRADPSAQNSGRNRFPG